MEIKEKIVIVGLFVIILLLWFLQQYLVNNLYTNSINMNTTNAQIHQYSLKNNALRMGLLQKESYTLIASEAATEGFIPAPIVTP